LPVTPFGAPTASTVEELQAARKLAAMAKTVDRLRRRGGLPRRAALELASGIGGFM
jgi:hypothetical protein